MEENPKATTAIVRAFLDASHKKQARLTPAEITALPAISAGAGTSGIGGIRTTILYGDPTVAGSVHHRAAGATQHSNRRAQPSRRARGGRGVGHVEFWLRRRQHRRSDEIAVAGQLLHRACATSCTSRERTAKRRWSTSLATGRPTRRTRRCRGSAQALSAQIRIREFPRWLPRSGFRLAPNLQPVQRRSHVRYSILFVLSLLAVGSFAQMPDQELAVVRTADDAALEWGPCPPFLPAGCGIAVLHGDPAKDNVDVFLRVPARSELPPHWHTSAARMVLVAGELHVTYDGQKKVASSPEPMPMGPRSVPHNGHCASASPCVLVHCLRIAPGCGADRGHGKTGELSSAVVLVPRALVVELEPGLGSRCEQVAVGLEP